MSDEEEGPETITLTIEPNNEIYFRGPYNKPVQVQFHLRNPTDMLIAFKVKTIDPKRYQVHPANGTVEPSNTVTILLELLPITGEEVESFVKSKQMFLMQTVISRKGATALQDIFDNALPEDIGESKFNCVFDNPEHDKESAVFTFPSSTGKQDPKEFVSFVGVITSRNGIPRVESTAAALGNAQDLEKVVVKADLDNSDDAANESGTSAKDEQPKAEEAKQNEPIDSGNVQNSTSEHSDYSVTNNIQSEKVDSSHTAKGEDIKVDVPKDLDVADRAKNILPIEDSKDPEKDNTLDNTSEDEEDTCNPQVVQDDIKPDVNDDDDIPKQISISTSVDGIIPRRKRRASSIVQNSVDAKPTDAHTSSAAKAKEPDNALPSNKNDNHKIEASNNAPKFNTAPQVTVTANSDNVKLTDALTSNADNTKVEPSKVLTKLDVELKNGASTLISAPKEPVNTLPTKNDYHKTEAYDIAPKLNTSVTAEHLDNELKSPSKVQPLKAKVYKPCESSGNVSPSTLDTNAANNSSDHQTDTTNADSAIFVSIAVALIALIFAYFLLR